MKDFTHELNASQRKVVMATEGPVLVIAGAGSGKTRVIEYRVLHLVQQGVNPASILLLTFTRRAAQQMLERAARHDSRCRFVEGGTFHSFAYAQLKKHGHRIGFQNFTPHPVPKSGTGGRNPERSWSFTILDEDDAQEALYLCAKKFASYEQDKRFPKKDTLRKIIGMAVNKELTIHQVLEREYPQFSDYAQAIECIGKEYTRFKREKSYCDFEDLLVHCKMLLSQDEQLRKKLSQQYQYIMVDEYQDTNKLQADITYLLSCDRRNIMVVGDDAQSIYGFRGASHKNIMSFPEQFKNCRLIKLEANYRSHQKILDVANAVLKDMKYKFAKHLESADKKKGEAPKLLLFRNSFAEAEWIADKILQLRDEGLDFFHQAVLFRSSYVSIPLQVELQRRGIPFAVFGGMKFYETAHVKDIVSHLKILVNPRDTIAWSRILRLLEGIGPKTAEKIIESMQRQSTAADLQGFIAQEKKVWAHTLGLRRLAKVLAQIAPVELPLEEKIAELVSYYEPILKDKFDDWNDRLGDLQALRSIAQNYAQTEDFLADFAIDPPERAGSAGTGWPAPGQRPLTLSTIHSAKGLEWECVFIIGLVEGVMPVSFSLHDEEGIEEEHRLLYVALTRAKDKLFLTAHHESSGFGRSEYNTISRFIDSPPVLARLEQSVVAEQYE